MCDIMMDNIFRLSDYDCIGFDMDHTVVQYHLPEHFQLVYKALAHYLIGKKGYNKHLLDEDFIKYEDFRACHGMKPLSDDEVKEVYGQDLLWKQFPILSESVFHGGTGQDTYRIFENFFDMPAAVISARIVDLIDEAEGKQKEYTFWPHVVEALCENFSPDSFRSGKGRFFPALKTSVEKYVKKCPEEVITWLRKVKASGKITFLLTGSYIDFTHLLMDYAVGNDWKDLFDYVFTLTGKPDFFKNVDKKKPFLTITPDFQEGTETSVLERGVVYSRGNACFFKETIKDLLKREQVKIVYFGDSPKSDVFPPFAYSSWDAVAVLEEMEAEEVHFHRSKSKDGLVILPTKRPKLAPLLKEEKIFIASNMWGSFFSHYLTSPICKDKERRETFWTSVMRKYSKIAIPLLDYIADLELDYPFPAFSADSEGFYPGPPSTFYQSHI